ncbi:MAG: ATP-binding protein [Deltaproteobacteria bacterium]
MPANSLLQKFLAPFVILLSGGLLGFSWWIEYSLEKYVEQTVEEDLIGRFELLAIQPQLLEEFVESGSSSEVLQAFVKKTRVHISILDPKTGFLLSDSSSLNPPKGDRSSLPEIEAAINNQPEVTKRFNPAFNKTALWFARRVPNKLGNDLILRVSLELPSKTPPAEGLFFKILLAMLLLMTATMITSLLIANGYRKSLNELRRGTARFAKGELRKKLNVPDDSEIGELSHHLNEMAALLNQRFENLENQRAERETILSSMEEGFMAVDKYHQVLRINRAAAQIFRLDPEKVVGQDLQLVVRNFQLSHSVHEALTSQQPLEKDFQLIDSQENLKDFQVRITPLRKSTGDQIGALIVLNDITRIKLVETIRKDFVANVSHELKTPITSIKGAVETLIDGAIEQREIADRFLRIIARHSDRMDSLISDLLLLSQLEYQDEGGLKDAMGALHSVILNSVGICELKAQKKDISLVWECSEKIVMRMNAPLLEQALVNLIDNAIKYSPEKRQVEIRATIETSEVIIEIQDQGSGIDTRHLDRIFERFYRVDAARSRKLGGTGLGLAIVKHIVQSHGGTVSVESHLNAGSKFTLKFPAPISEKMELDEERKVPETFS